jgi:hypothetical protein
MNRYYFRSKRSVDMHDPLLLGFCLFVGGGWGESQSCIPFSIKKQVYICALPPSIPFTPHESLLQTATRPEGFMLPLMARLCTSPSRAHLLKDRF